VVFGFSTFWQLVIVKLNNVSMYATLQCPGKQASVFWVGVHCVHQ